MTKTNENVDMMKPTFNVVENSAGGVFISTPPSSPPKRFQDRMKNVTEFFVSFYVACSIGSVLVVFSVEFLTKMG